MLRDAVEAAPDVYTVLFENERVRVLEAAGEVGAVSPLHGHPDLVGYAVTDFSMKIAGEDGQSVQIDGKAGDTFFQEASAHSVEIGKSGSLILVELK